MPSKLRSVSSSHPRIARKGLVATLAAVTGIVLVPTGAAEPPPSIAEVRARVDELHEQAAEANEKYHVASELLEDIQRRLENATLDVKRQEEKLDQLTADIGGFAAAAYRAGGVEPTMYAMLATDPAEFLSRASAIDAFAAQQAEQLDSVAAERQQLAANELVVEEEQSRQKAIEAKLAGHKAKVDKLLAEQQELLDRLTAEERARLERERQREREAAQAARRQAAEQLSRSADPAPSQDSAPEPAIAAPSGSASSRAQIAVQAALSKVGAPYVYGGKGPDSFDCSGFTSWAWAQAGVSLSPSSQAQINQGQRVSSDQLLPGDLLFYGSPISHVAMYIGNGQVVHASNPITDVTIAPAMQAGGSSKPYVGATRPG